MQIRLTLVHPDKTTKRIGNFPLEDIETILLQFISTNPSKTFSHLRATARDCFVAIQQTLRLDAPR